MAKKIKKTLPWFLILALIGLVIGVGLNLGKSKAEAEGVPATVEVGNVLPVITEVTVDSSDCTTPINVGLGVTFTATATDINGDTWKLLVCKTSGTTGVACTGTQRCVSTSGVASGSPNSCTYTPVVAGDYNDGAWFAYACDSTGCTADDNANSPFYVNREPSFTVGSGGAANPGANAAFTTTASDPDDTADGCAADQVKLFICATEGATASGCSGTQLCTAALGADNPGCDYEVTIPTSHGLKDYYPYVFDTHSMAAGGDQQGIVDTYTVNNVVPTITSVSLNGGSLIQLDIKPNTTNVAAISTDVTDNNGYGDITGATAVIYRTTKTDACSANDNNCYQIATGSCVQSAGSGATCTYTCTAAFKYYADPTDGSSGYNDTWTAKMTASDEIGPGSQTSLTVELETNTALDVTEAGINYEVVAAGADTGAVNETTTVVNYGNSPIDTTLYGVDMTKVGNGVTIVVTQQKYALAAFTYSSGGTALLVTPGVNVDTDTTKPTNDNAVSDDVLWGIGIPGGQATGNYTGTNTFSALIDADNWPS